MTILQKLLQRGDGHAASRWHGFGRGDRAVRYTEAWEHETFAEEQARWERNDPDYARICEQVRQAKRKGGEASRRAHEAKAEWDARVATQRQANDDAQRAHHVLEADQAARRRPVTSRSLSQRWKSGSLESTRTPRLAIAPREAIRAREGQPHMHTTFAIESNDSLPPGIMPGSVSVHDEPAVTTAPRGEREAERPRSRALASEHSVGKEPTKLEVV
jgi:hypothetical protein